MINDPKPPFYGNQINGTGVGLITLGPALGGMASMIALGTALGYETPYLILDGANKEWGIGTIYADGTFTRDTVQGTIVNGVLDENPVGPLAISDKQRIMIWNVEQDAALNMLNQGVATGDSPTFAGLGIGTLTVHGSANMNGDWFNVGGGYGATGVTLKGDTGNILANGTLTVDGAAAFAGDVTLPTLQLSGNASQIALSDPALTQMDFDFPASVGVDKTFRFGRVTDLGGGELNFILYDGAGTGTPGITLKGSGNGIFQGDITANGGVFRNGSFDIVAGADDAAATVSNLTNKTMRFAIPHYLTAEEHVSAINASSQASTSVLNIGGGSSAANAVTEINFYTAANNITPDGTLALSIDDSQNTTAHGQLRVRDGTPSGLSIAFANDLDTGMYRRGGDQLAFVTGGVERGYWADGGAFVAHGRAEVGGDLKTGGATSPAALSVKIDYDVTASTDSAGILTENQFGTQQWLMGGGVSGVSNEHWSVRDVTNGLYALTIQNVTGDATFAGDVAVDGFISKASDTEQLSLGGGDSGSKGFNSIYYGPLHATRANDGRFRVGTTDVLSFDGDTFDGIFTGNVGIGGVTPAFSSGGGLHINHPTISRMHLTTDITGVTGSDGFDIGIGTDSAVFFSQRENADMSFFVNGSESLRLNSTGSVQALSTLTVDGDLNVNGFVLRYNGDIIASDDVGAPVISGGAGPAIGANIKMYAGAHVGTPNNMELRAGSTPWLSWDDSANTATFAGNIESSGTIKPVGAAVVSLPSAVGNDGAFAFDSVAGVPVYAQGGIWKNFSDNLAA